MTVPPSFSCFARGYALARWPASTALCHVGLPVPAARPAPRCAVYGVLVEAALADAAADPGAVLGVLGVGRIRERRQEPGVAEAGDCCMLPIPETNLEP